jgi:hypothetical protein
VHKARKSIGTQGYTRTGCARLDAVYGKSCYELAFGVSPGGARKCTHYVRATLDEVKTDLADELSASSNVYLLCWYGAELALHVYEQGRRVHSIDLHPYTTISIDGYPDITFLDSGNAIGPDVEAVGWSKFQTPLCEAVFAGELDDAIKVTVDWDSVQVPPLVGDIATDDSYIKPVDHLGSPGDDDDLDDFDEDDLESELLDRGYIPYGYSDCEE